HRSVRDRRGLPPREPILRPGRKLPMPMNNGWGVSFVREVHAKSFARGKANSGTSIRTRKSKDLSWSTIHLDHTCSGDETLSSGCGARNRRQYGQDADSERRGQNPTTREVIAHGIVPC